MMPAVLRQSGPKFIRKEDGVLVTPRAIVASCEVCGISHAPFGIKDAHGNLEFFCKSHLPKERNVA